MDIDPQMVMLATLNMLLNGDGNAKIKQKRDMDLYCLNLIIKEK